MTVREAAEGLEISKATVYGLNVRGELENRTAAAVASPRGTDVS